MKKIFILSVLSFTFLFLIHTPSWAQEGVSVEEVRSTLNPHIERMEEARNQMNDQYGSWQAVETLKTVLGDVESGEPRSWGQWLYLSWSAAQDKFYNQHINILRQSMSYARTLDSLGQDDMSYLDQGVQAWFQKEQRMQDAFGRLVENYSSLAQNYAAIERKNDQLKEAGLFDQETREGREAELEELQGQLQTLTDERKEIEQRQDAIRDEIADLHTGLVFSALNSSQRVDPSKSPFTDNRLVKDTPEEEGSIMDQMDTEGVPELIAEERTEEVPLNDQVEPDLEDWEKDAAAAMGAAMSDAEGEEALTEEFENNREFQDNQEARRNPDKVREDDLRDLQNQNVEERRKEEARLREERLQNLDKESLERMREDAKESMDRFERIVNERAEKEGREWTPEEEAEFKRRSDRYADVMEPTALENDEIARRQAVNDRMNKQLRDFADSLGRSSEDVVAERLQTAKEFDAATEGWRDFLMTGEAVNMVKDDIVHQRELGIKAQSDIIAAKAFLQRGNLTPEERHATEQFLERAIQRRHAAAEAIVVDGATVMTGMGLDAASAGVGGTVSRGVSRFFGSKAGQKAGEAGLRTLATEEAAQQAPRRAPTHVGEPTPAQVQAAQDAHASLNQIAEHELKFADEAAALTKAGEPTPAQVQAAKDAHASLNQIAEHELKFADEAAGLTKAGEPTPAQVQAARDAHASLNQIAEHELKFADEAAGLTKAGEPTPAQVQAAKDAHASLNQVAEHELDLQAALRTHNQAAERELAERLAQEADQAEYAYQQARREGRQLTPREEAAYMDKLRARNYNSQMNDLLEEARRAGVSEDDLAHATQSAYDPFSAKSGNSASAQFVTELIAQARGHRVIPHEQAYEVMSMINNVQTGAAGRAEVEILRRNIQAAERQGVDFFDDVTKQGTVSSDGYEAVADELDVEALRRFAQENGLTK